MHVSDIFLTQRLLDPIQFHIGNNSALLEQNQDKIIIVKFFAPWCRACKGLEPKFVQISKNPKYDGLPLVFAQLSVANSKEYVKALGVLALPSVHIYAGGEGLVENFPCGPSKVPILKKKIAQVVNQKVDPKTFELKPFCDSTNEAEPCTTRSIATTGSVTKLSVGDVVVKQETMDYLRNDVVFFKDLTDEEFDGLMKRSTYSTFEAGSIIMKQGMPGETFYVIDSGTVEILVKGAFEDPLTTPAGYLGAVVNSLEKNNYFGERALLTGQPRAASIRSVTKTRCFTFDMADIPASSSLSGKTSPTQERVAQVNDKYAVDYYNINLISDQFKNVSILSQVRGSTNRPYIIEGVDTDDDDVVEGGSSEQKVSKTSPNDSVLSLLVRFKLLRQAGRCFKYISKTSPKWGDQGEVNRRSLLVSKLTRAQRSEFIDVFKMIDSDNDGTINVSEMKRVLDVIDDQTNTETDIQEMINKANPSVDGNLEVTLTEFLGVMAEAEFYYLFKDTFATLDPHNSGYVQAGKLDKILCGLRDLISDDRMSIIDIDDKDMLIDYESFSRMMIGTA
jgi:calmodulin